MIMLVPGSLNGRSILQQQVNLGSCPGDLPSALEHSPSTTTASPYVVGLNIYGLGRMDDEPEK